MCLCACCSFDPFVATNGILGGLVAITASSPMVETEASFVIGVLSGVLVFYGSKLVLRLKVRYCQRLGLAQELHIGKRLRPRVNLASIFSRSKGVWVYVLFCFELPGRPC